MERIEKKLQNLRTVRLKVSHGFHSKLMKDSSDRFETMLRDLDGVSNKTDGHVQVFSNETGAPYDESEDVKAKLARHVTHQVKFVKMIKRMYENGARVFLEIGPGGTISKLVKKILCDVKDEIEIITVNPDRSK